MLIIIFFILALFTDLSSNQHLTPSCSVKDEVTEKRCAVFKKIPSFDGITISQNSNTIVGKLGDCSYKNITVTYKTKAVIGALIITQASNISLNKTMEIWEVMPVVLPEKSLVPITVSINYLPDSEIEVRKVFSDTLCNEKSVNDCRTLHSSKLYLKQYSKYLKLEFINSGLLLNDITISLYSSDCYITCIDPKSKCLNDSNGLLKKNYKWNEFLQNDLKFYDTSSGFHCAQIKFTHDCCSPVATSTIKFEQKSNPQIVYRASNSNLFWLVLGGVLVAIFYSCLLLYYTKSKKRITYEEVIEPLSSPQTKESELQTVFLLYKYDPGIKPVVKNLSVLLSVYAKKILDPYDDSEIEKVSSSPSEWLKEVLNSKTKIIIIENDSNTLYHLSNFYDFALSILLNNAQFSIDYKNVFVIRFKPKIDNSVKILVPCTRYEIPQHLVFLIKDISGNHEQNEVTSAELSANLKRFHTSINTYLNHDTYTKL